MEKISGIYCIENLVNTKKYIGQSVDVYERLRKHKSMLKNNRHNNKHLQNAYNTYGFNNFTFFILEKCNTDLLDERECYYITLYTSCDSQYGYNIESGGNKYKTISESTKEKLRIANIGKVMPDEVKEKISKSNKGREISDEQKEFLRQLHTGLQHSEETKKKIGILSKRENRSEETLEKMRESHKKENLSSETLNKMKESHQKENLSIETLEKMRESHLGKQLTDEQKNKIKLSLQSQEWRKVSVYCPQLDENFASMKDAEDKYKLYGVNKSKISACLHGKRTSSGKHPITGEPLTWEKNLKE